MGEGSATPTPPAGARKPAVETTVKATSPRAVVVGAGKMDKDLAEGDVLYITRDGKPVGTVKVVRAYEHLAGAKILEVMPGDTIQKDDRATTEMPGG